MVNISTFQKGTRNTKWPFQLQSEQSCLAFGVGIRLGNQGRNEAPPEENNTHEAATPVAVWGHR